jgi:hypothetical protein
MMSLPNWTPVAIAEKSRRDSHTRRIVPKLPDDFAVKFLPVLTCRSARQSRLKKHGVDYSDSKAS